MSRRLPILPLTFAAMLGAFALSSVILAQPPAAPKADARSDVRPGDIRRSQEENLKLYKRFAEEMLRLAQRWEKSDSPEERDRAKSLRTALKLVEEKGVENLFKDLVKGLGNNNLTGTDFNDLLGKDRKLVDALNEILRVLETEDESERLKREIAELTELKKEIERLKREQENIRARTENPKGDAEKIAQAQKDLTRQTQDAANKFPGSKDPKDGKGGNANAGKDDRAEPKPEGKPGDSSPEAKPDTPETKSDNKAGDGGSPMDPKAGPAAGGEPKPSPMGGMDAGTAKEAPKDPAGGGDPKAGGEAKPMAGTPSDPKAGGEQKPMAGDSKAQGDGKGDGKPSAGQQGGDAKPMSGQQGGMPGGGQPSQSKPGGGQPGGGGQPSPGGQPKPKDDAQENVQQAVPQQQGAEDDLRKNDRDNASKKEDEAIRRLQAAIEELEKRLKQLREKELAKLLANLEERVNRMLRMQIEVYTATKGLDSEVVKNNNQKTTAHIQRSQVEADKELLIIAEADKALKLMEGEGSAVVFAGVLSEVRGDMQAVQRRLSEARVEGRNKANEAEGTQLIEEQIIEQLTLMKEALKKAKQDLENQQNKPPQDPNSGGKPNNKLLDLINELKLIKSLQEQVNKRTVSYSKQDPGEQAKDPLIQGELKQLSDRQRVLQEMLHKIATQANQ